jgi:hypothetical protein
VTSNYRVILVSQLLTSYSIASNIFFLSRISQNVDEIIEDDQLGFRLKDRLLITLSGQEVREIAYQEARCLTYSSPSIIRMRWARQVARVGEETFI